MKFLHASLLALQGLAPSVECNNSFAKQCSAMATTLNSQLDNVNTHVTLTEYIPAGNNASAESTHPTCDGFDAQLDFDLCRIQLTSATSDRSAISLETWLPLNWTGRFLSVGNGGLGGCISYADMAYAAGMGFAVVGTNNGHDGNTGRPMLRNPEVQRDSAWRAVHAGVVLGKEISRVFYGKGHTKAYYLGCSTGGRQGFKEAQDFPDDFDGIVAGAPAFDWNNLMAWELSFYGITGKPGSDTFLTSDQWDLVINDVVKQCDGLDGHLDGVIEDPDLCQYRPERLICGQQGETTTNCLTGTQAETVRKVYSPLYDSTGTLLYPRMQPGGNSTAALWSAVPFQYSLDWWRYVIYEDPSWGPNLTLRDIAAANRADTFGISTWKADLSGFRDRGAKILHYHGLQDALISSDNSARYYDHVSRGMGLRSNELDGFYRYFRISGMAHCTGGTGAYNIGNRASSYAGDEAEGNVLAAMVRWVEEGVAPEYVLGTAYVDDGKTEVAFRRRHCRYPLRNRYKGSGDADDAENWECV